MANTSNANWRGIYLSESDADHDLRFDYVRYSSTGTGQHILRYTDANNLLYVEITPTTLFLRQRDGGTLTTLDTYTTTVSEDAWYSARAVLDGANLNVWWGAQGGTFYEVLSTTSATELTTTAASYFRASPSSEHGLDNITLIAGTRSTTQTFTHNDANVQITSTVNGVTTDMTYDESGRLTERDDGTHTATYAYRYGSKLYSVASDFPGEGSVTYETGGDQKRRSRVAGADETWYNWTADWFVLSEEDDSDGVNGSLIRTYWDGNLGYVDGNSASTGAASYYSRDHIRSVCGIWNAGKTQFAKYEYDPYGGKYDFVDSQPSAAQRFSQHDFDDSVGLFYTPFRYYDSKTCRWLSRDPNGMVDGPNMYVYGNENPISSIDPWGLSVIYHLGDDTEPGDKMKELLECIAKELGKDIRVTGGTSPKPPKISKHGKGSEHDGGNAADIGGNREGDPGSCDVSNAAKNCAEKMKLNNLRACKSNEDQRTHIDFGSKKSADCSKWGKLKNGDPVYSKCCED